jgi:hypothetical protein
MTPKSNELRRIASKVRNGETETPRFAGRSRPARRVVGTRRLTSAEKDDLKKGILEQIKKALGDIPNEAKKAVDDLVSELGKMAVGQ